MFYRLKYILSYNIFLKKKIFITKYLHIAISILALACLEANAQFTPNKNNPFSTNFGQQPSSKNSKDDSLMHRTGLEDSITIRFRYFDSTRSQLLDNSINSFNKYLSLPEDYIYLGGLGNASRSILFSPQMLPGWDAGFHAYDAYTTTIENTRFFNTTRPYTQLNYLIGSRAEQLINVLHTQNFTPNWNMALNYHLVSTPGWFKSQKINHNNVTINSFYQTRNKRYSIYFIYISNKINGSENGGIIHDGFLKDLRYKDRELIPTRLGGDAAYSTNFFTSAITTGNTYSVSNVLFRHQYDLGQKDSLRINDSITVKLFYARLRFQHTFQYNTYSYAFLDTQTDSANYKNYFQITIHPNDTISFKDKWKEMINTLSILSYPDKKNQNQFLNLGIAIQNLKGFFTTQTINYYNLYALAEYRNKTRNQLWDMEAKGKLYVNGVNMGDYHGYISLQRFISQKIGSLSIGFENVNRTPSFIFDPKSSFLQTGPTSLNKENTTHIFGTIDNPHLKIKLTGDYYLINNYTYFNNLYNVAQEKTLLNLIHVSASKKIDINKYLKWYVDIHIQQASNTSILVPLLFTKDKLAFEGVFFKNLNLSTGIEIRYHTPYKAYDYCPINGQFYTQQSTTITNRPEASIFAHFAIKNFRGYVRFENLNTFDFKNGGAFTSNNLTAPLYPSPGLIFRFGIAWKFIN